MQWKRVAVSLFAALELPFAVAAGVNLTKDFTLSLIFIIVAVVMTYMYAWYKPYWENGNNNRGHEKNS
jgi:hypothetical protein